MNREIKFRIWDKREKKFVTDWYKGIGITGDIIFIDEKWRPVDDDFVFQQFTGLKDKKEKEIYEGDILRITWTKPKSYLPSMANNPRETVQQTCEVIFKKGTFSCHPYCGLHNIFDCIVKNSEIIGDIFENPEIKTTSNYEVIGDAPDLFF